ncbi:hypothetical protein CEP54_000950 [Fusarium duplospermum]|uniref:Beta-lactamase-related domain-containing protein n=1 Tax=Fusarium duplospermum TaxID=1325734 RepID=A0A428R4A2_9HYPO|nr:hypothetical protein CEP54_000950 [Fusarium duplospermum]
MKPSTLPLLGLLWLSLASTYCPSTRSVPPPPIVSSDGNLLESLAESLKGLGQSSKSWNDSTKPFFVKVASKYENLSSFHHPAKSLNKTSAHNVTNNFIYRMASLTKIFTVTLLLQNKIDLDDPASK